ncbi:MAG: galactoside O-acetyltransferase [Lachnospiraceae bacterium]|nr:galactoside O-acetyltransferase [Lachnospiraceae bacterium]
MEELRVDMRERTKDEQEMYDHQTQLMFKLNHTMPRTPEYMEVLKELFGDHIGEGTYLAAPLNGAAIEKLVIGKNCFINANLLAMARGGITIGDNVQIAANVQLLSNNHDPYDRSVLTCKPILIKDGAWIGAGASILPGVTIGRHAIVGAASVVTHDVGDYEVAVGNPARVIKKLDPDKF